MITLATFLTTTGGTFAVNLLSSFLKRYVMPRWGVTGVHVVVLILSIVASSAMQYYLVGLPDLTTLEGVKQFFTWSGVVFTAAISFYEVLWKRLGMN